VVQKILVFPIFKKISNTHHKDNHIKTSHTYTQNEMKVSNGWNGFLSFPSMHMKKIKKKISFQRWGVLSK